MPSYVVWYTLDAKPVLVPQPVGAITRLRIEGIWPRVGGWIAQPVDFEGWLADLRSGHECGG